MSSSLGSQKLVSSSSRNCSDSFCVLQLLTKLTGFKAHSNDLVGSIPTEIGLLTSLEELEIGRALEDFRRQQYLRVPTNKTFHLPSSLQNPIA